MLYSLDLFKLFFSKSAEPLEDNGFDQLRSTFEELILAVLSRITREGSDDNGSELSPLKRAKSIVDEDHSTQLVKSAFNEIFRLFDSYNKR